MSYTVRFQGVEYAMDAGENVLDCLLRHGVPMPHACRMGACESCILRVVAGEIPDEFSEGLPDSMRKQGCFYSCICQPRENIEVELPE